jgi:hypothetical protein
MQGRGAHSSSHSHAWGSACKPTHCGGMEELNRGDGRCHVCRRVRGAVVVDAVREKCCRAEVNECAKVPLRRSDVLHRRQWRCEGVCSGVCFLSRDLVVARSNARGVCSRGFCSLCRQCDCKCDGEPLRRGVLARHGSHLVHVAMLQCVDTLLCVLHCTMHAMHFPLT